MFIISMARFKPFKMFFKISNKILLKMYMSIVILKTVYNTKTNFTFTITHCCFPVGYIYFLNLRTQLLNVLYYLLFNIFPFYFYLHFH